MVIDYAILGGTRADIVASGDPVRLSTGNLDQAILEASLKLGEGIYTIRLPLALLEASHQAICAITESRRG